MFLLSFNIKNPRALSSFLNRGPTWLMEYGVDDDTHIVQFPMRGSFPPYLESFTGIWSIWAIWSKLVGSARQLYYYWKCYQHLSPFHLSSPHPTDFFFRFLFQSCARKKSRCKCHFQCWINRIYLYSLQENERRTLCRRHCACLNSPEKIPVSLFPMIPLLPKVRRRMGENKLFFYERSCDNF
jgi:hypothetical protein